jgi:hypothetical protein
VLRLARLLEPPVHEEVTDALVSAALVPGARQLIPLTLLVDENLAAAFRRTFSVPELDDRAQAAAILRELATYGEHRGHCSCVSLARSLGPFAFALVGVPHPLYSRLGEILLDDVVRVIDPLADPRLLPLRARAAESEAHRGAL